MSENEKLVTCDHWNDCGVRGGGCCAIEKYGARSVAYGACLRFCTSRVHLGIPQKPDIKAPLPQAQASPPVPRKKLNPRGHKYDFCYFTASNRSTEAPIIASLIASARDAGVVEDIHVFSTRNIPGGINHELSALSPWKNHMAKLDLLLEVAKLDYDYFVWLDTDNYFVRDPGDLSDLLRGNPIWVSMEAELSQNAHGDWYGMQVRGEPSLVDLMLGAGCPKNCVRGTNGGMWIVRKEAVQEFHRRAFAAWEYLKSHGYPEMTDEPPLSVVGSTMIADPQNNTVEKFGHIWAAAWMDEPFKFKLPDGKPWTYKEWLTQKDVGKINPAIVHNMRGKHLMAAEFSHLRLPDSIPLDQWPPKIHRIAKRRIATDKGIGDILQRRYARWGGEIYKKLRKLIGWPCSCEMTQDNLNAMYPFPGNEQ